jgi:hypothetical protein
MNKVQQIIDEINQIREQFKREVPGVGRAWPSSLRDRIRVLSQSGLSDREIFKRTGIPLPTIYVWRKGRCNELQANEKPQGKFLSVQLKRNRTEGYQDPAKELIRNLNSGDLTANEFNGNGYVVVLPGGLRVEGLSLEAIVELSRRMST